MKHSYLNIYEGLLAQSLLIPDIVNRSRLKDNAFLVHFDQWLITTEEIMKCNSIAQCAEIAGLRSKIISASYRDGDKESTKRKRQLSVATSVIYDAQNTVLNVIEPIENRINEARDAVRQLLGLAYQANMIDLSKNFNFLIQSLWSTFASHEQLKSITARILILVSQSDALRLLAEEIDLSRN
jgi:hypothetical protein